MKLCRIHRFAASLLLDRPRLPRTIDRHLASCPECRRQLENERTLRARLIASARSANHSAPPFLAARIVANLPDSGRMPGSRRTGALATLTALSLFAGLSLLVWNPFTTRLATNRATTTSSPPLALAALPDQTDLGQWNQAFEKPLRSEVGFAMADARQAVASLAECFLPEHSARALIERTER